MQQYEILLEKAGFLKYSGPCGHPRDSPPPTHSWVDTLVDFLLTIQVQNFSKNIFENKEMVFKKWIEKYKQRVIMAQVQ